MKTKEFYGAFQKNKAPRELNLEKRNK